MRVILLCILLTIAIASKWDAIDESIHHAIVGRVTPGAVVYAEREGKTLYHKAFGSFTYNNVTAVTPNRYVWPFCCLPQTS